LDKPEIPGIQSIDFLNVTAQPGHFADNDSWSAGAADVSAQVLAGAVETAYKNIKEKPAATALMLAEGTAVGIGIVAAPHVVAVLGAKAATVAAVGLASDTALVGLTATGLAASGRDSVRAASAASTSAAVLMHSSQYSRTKIDSARRDIRTRTGGAALEALGASAMTVGTMGNSLKLVSVCSDFLKGGFRPLTMVNSFSTADYAAAPSFFADRKTGGAQFSDSFVRASYDGVPFSTDRAIADSLQSLPAGRVIKFTDSIDRFLSTRQKEVNVVSLKRSLTELYERDNRPLLIDKSGPQPRAIAVAEFSDVLKVRRLLNDDPTSLAAYEQYLPQHQKMLSLKRQIEFEIGLRRRGLSEVINQEATNLFPNMTVPKLEIVRLDPGYYADAVYSRGRLFIKDSDLMVPHNFRRFPARSQLAERLVHEIKHGEQDGILLRHYIDETISSDTTGRALTEAERTAVQNKYEAKFGKQLPPAMIDDINTRRAGKPLTAEEVSRVGALEEGLVALRSRGAQHQTERDNLTHLSGDYQLLRAGILPANVLEPGAYKFIKTENFNAELVQLQANYTSLPVLNQVRETNPEFIRRAYAVLEPILSRELAAQSKIVGSNYREYRGWHHEQEAFHVQEQTQGELAQIAALSLKPKVPRPVRGPSASRQIKLRNRELAFKAFLDMAISPPGLDYLRLAEFSKLPSESAG